MRPLPTPPAPGKPVSATLIRQLIDAIRERTILPGLNTSTKRCPNGTVMNFNNPGTPGRNSEFKPWTFSCTNDPDTGERKGGWYNQIIQVGYKVYRHDNPLIGFKDETGHEDGEYYIKIDLSKGEFSEDRITIVLEKEDDEDGPRSDYTKGIIVVYIGTVKDGKQTRGIYWPPVIYIYE